MQAAGYVSSIGCSFHVVLVAVTVALPALRGSTRQPPCGRRSGLEFIGSPSGWVSERATIAIDSTESQPRHRCHLDTGEPQHWRPRPINLIAAAAAATDESWPQDRLAAALVWSGLARLGSVRIKSVAKYVLAATRSIIGHMGSFGAQT